MTETMIENLSGSAARLLLVYLTAPKNDSPEVLITRSGIRTWKTYEKARNELIAAQFLKIGPDGNPYIEKAHFF